MAKINDLQNSFSTSRKGTGKPSIDDIERITATVEKTSIENAQSTTEEEIIKTSIDFTASMYRDMKIRLLDKRQSMKEYIWELIRKDMYDNK